MLCRPRNAAVFAVHVFKASSRFLHSSSPQTHPNFPIPRSNSPPSHVVNPSSLLSDLVSCAHSDMAGVFALHKRELTSNLVLGVLRGYKQLGRAKTLKFFSLAGSHMGFHFDDSVVEYMADFLGRRKLFDDIKCLLTTVAFHKGGVSPKALAICIRFLGRQGRIKEALSLFEDTETVFKCKPDNLVCNNMLYVLCKRESSLEMIQLAHSIFHKIETPDTYSCSNMIVGFCKFGRVESALEIFNQMEKIGVLPTRSAVNMLIGELCLTSAKEGSVEKVRVRNTRRPYTILVPNMGGNSDAMQPAVQVFWAVSKAGLLPSSFVVVKVMCELCRLGNTEEAGRVLRIVEERKLRCVHEGYSVVIKALCECHKVKEASDLFGRMLSLGLKPKLVVYNSVILMLCKLGKLKDATRVFEIMNKNRCLPDDLTYTALIHGHGEGKNWKVAYDLLIEMLGLGLLPNFDTYNLVESLLREHGRLDLCVKLDRKLENQKLQKLCRGGELDAAYEKVKSMLEKGIPLSAYARDIFEQVFQKCGKLKIARQLLENTERVQKAEEIDKT
ncbi:pentatricopeptide repeat-containing protein At1g63070, mitochondrial-like [Vigna unguiculata]|uniref:pentatricopeptide repeat-containing protein At1g63070, mitochondrial-like n=1 Tax=Vigna unguiculata TaxID=3917 RepID=UPI0010167237|nr:pentatricopeptide repeat-containing protein At1g63070, mitochondrial-like [Vigna unguiculata]